MPDSNELRSSELPSSEDLDKVVEEQAVAEATSLPLADVLQVVEEVAERTVNKSNDIPLNRTPGQCFRCINTPINFCKHCGQEFCSDHKSRYSTQICILCVASDNLGIEYVPLVEEELQEDGTFKTHQGRRIKLIGEGWPNTMQMIESLTEEGLEIFIAERQRLLKEAILNTEYHRITLAKAEFSKEYKRRSKVAKLNKRREELQKQGSIRLGGRVMNMSGTAKGPRIVKQDDSKIAASLGLTVEQYNVLKKLVKK